MIRREHEVHHVALLFHINKFLLHLNCLPCDQVLKPICIGSAITTGVFFAQDEERILAPRIELVVQFNCGDGLAVGTVEAADRLSQQRLANPLGATPDHDSS